MKRPTPTCPPTDTAPGYRRWLPGLALFALLTLAACGGGGNGDDNGSDDPGETPTDATAPANGSAASPTIPAMPDDTQEPVVETNVVCPPEDPDKDDGYCDFVEDVAGTVEGGETPAILDALVGETVTCDDDTPPCDEAGETVEVVARTYNGVGENVAVDVAEGEIQSLLDNIDAEASDDYGDGALQLHAVATGFTEVSDRALVFSGISRDGERFTVMLQIASHEGGWVANQVSILDENTGEFLEAIASRQSAPAFWKWQLAETLNFDAG